MNTVQRQEARAAESTRSFSFAKKTDEPMSFRPAAATPTPAPAPAPNPAQPVPVTPSEAHGQSDEDEAPIASFAPVTDDDADTALDLSSDDAIAADAKPEIADASNEELILGAETIVAQPPEADAGTPFGRKVDTSATPAASAATPEDGSQRRRWLSPGGEETDAAPQPKVKMGGTLFERMSNAARGVAREEGATDGDDDAIDIPRFLHRQNNQ